MLRVCIPLLILASCYSAYRQEEDDGSVIIEKKKEPKFIELPEDVEAFEGSTALFMCRILSLLPLHVRWYKQVAKNPSAILYENKYYQVLNGTNTNKNGDVYVSKLKFKSVTIADTGTYACGAVSEAGIQYRASRLIVSPVTIPPPPRAPPGPWKITLFGSAAGFLLVLFASFCCVRAVKFLCGCCHTSSPQTHCHRQPVMHTTHRHNPPRRNWVPEPETSDYEHVVTL